MMNSRGELTREQWMWLIFIAIVIVLALVIVPRILRIG